MYYLVDEQRVVDMVAQQLLWLALVQQVAEEGVFGYILFPVAMPCVCLEQKKNNSKVSKT